MCTIINNIIRIIINLTLVINSQDITANEKGTRLGVARRFPTTTSTCTVGVRKQSQRQNSMCIGARLRLAARCGVWVYGHVTLLRRYAATPSHCLWRFVSEYRRTRASRRHRSQVL